MDNESLRNLSFTCKAYYLLIHDCRLKYLKLYLLRMILTNEKQTSGWMKNYINFRFPIPRTCQNLSVESLKIRNALVDDSFCKLLRNFLIENNDKIQLSDILHQTITSNTHLYELFTEAEDSLKDVEKSEPVHLFVI
ncbi:unnamed protein product [Auanema sp. JU1783]|nr:unnamed protein product [Auanema sp. JU1783]